jgi:bifunctional DNase/RNase
VRVDVPIYVADSVMERAGVVPSEQEDLVECEGKDLSAFRDFVDTLDMDDLDQE